jgi:hypothetical protein
MPLQVGDKRRVRQRRKVRPRDKGKAKAEKEFCNFELGPYRIVRRGKAS